jgi:hypothetical protein
VALIVQFAPGATLQDCNISFAGGGMKNCLDSQLAGTGPRDQTLSQVFVLSSEQGTTSAEIYYQDLQCAILSGSSCAGPGGVQSAYKAAILSLAAGQPAAAAALVGAAQATGAAQIF